MQTRLIPVNGSSAHRITSYNVCYTKLLRIAYQFQLLINDGKTTSFTIMATRIDEEVELVSDVGRFSLEWNQEKKELLIYAGDLTGANKAEAGSLIVTSQADTADLIDRYVLGIRQIVNLLFTKLKGHNGPDSLEFFV